MRRAMAGLMFLSVVLSAQSAFAAWQTDDSALLGVGIIALLAIAAAIHFRVGLIFERGQREKLQKAALGAERNLEAELKAGGVHVLTFWRGRDDGEAARKRDLEALSNLLAADACAEVSAAVDGLAAHGKALAVQCAGRVEGETYDVSGFAAARGEVTIILCDRSRGGSPSAKLDAELNHLRTVLDALELPVWRRAEDLNLNWCNAAYADHVDSSRRQVLRGDGPELISGVPVAEARALAREALETQTPSRARHHVVVAGERRLLDIVESPVAEGGGTIGWARDISDLEQAKTDLKRHIEAHAQVLHSLNTSIAIYAADTLLIFFNSEFVKLFKMDEGWLAGGPTLSEVLEAQRERRRLPEQADWRLYKNRVNDLFTSVTEPEEELLHLPDGATLITYLDITDSFQVERALRDRAQALEAADRLKSEFIANVSYELRTPLNTVIGFTKILANQYFGQLNERQQEYVSGILQFSQQLLSLINNILDLATIEAGLMVLKIESVDLRATLLSMLNLIQERVRSKQLQVEFECEIEIGRMEADERRLKQIVFNLFNNAIKYTPAGGAMTPISCSGCRIQELALPMRSMAGCLSVSGRRIVRSPVRAARGLACPW